MIHYRGWLIWRPFCQICSPCPNFFLTVEAYLELRVMFLDKYSVTRQNQAYLICLIAEKKLRTKYGQQSRYDSWGARGEGARGVPNGTSQGPHWLCEEQHPSSDQLQVGASRGLEPYLVKTHLWLCTQEQQEAAGQGEGFRPPLQHGVGGGEGDVDWVAQDRQGWVLLTLFKGILNHKQLIGEARQPK